MNEREEKYYEKFKSNEISNENIRKGEAKAKNLGDLNCNINCDILPNFF